MADREILIQFGEQRITKSLKDILTLNDLIESVKQYFSITDNNGSIILQRYDDSWEEWVDIIHFEEVKDRAKVKAILIQHIEDVIAEKRPPAVVPPILGKVGFETVAEYEKSIQNANAQTPNKYSTVSPSMISVHGASNSVNYVIDQEEIKRRSQIYNLNPDDRLYAYRKAINEATFVLALKNPSLLDNKVELQRQARHKLNDDGFPYKHKKSRSKELGGTQSTPSPSKIAPRVHVSQEIRRKWASELHEDLNEVQLQIDYATLERERCASSKNFSKALHISKQVEELKIKKRKFENELTQLNKKESQNKRVKKCIEGKAKTGPLNVAGMKETVNHASKDTDCSQNIQHTPIGHNHTTKEEDCSPNIQHPPAVQFKEIEHELPDLTSIGIYSNQNVASSHCNQNHQSY